MYECKLILWKSEHTDIIFNIFIVIGKRWYKDTDEHYYATEKDLQPPLYVSTH